MLQSALVPHSFGNIGWFSISGQRTESKESVGWMHKPILKYREAHAINKASDKDQGPAKIESSFSFLLTTRTGPGSSTSTLARGGDSRKIASTPTD